MGGSPPVSSRARNRRSPLLGMEQSPKMESLLVSQATPCPENPLPHHAHTGPFFLVLILGPLGSPLPSSLVGLDQGPGFPTYPVPQKSVGLSASTAKPSVSGQI